MKKPDERLSAVSHRLSAVGQDEPAVTDSRQPGTRAAGDADSHPPHLGEVIAADSVRFEAECRRLYGAPAFGSFVRVEGAGRSIFGVVAHIATAAMDPGRRTQALHLPPERLAERMPQLELVLRTCFAALVIGYGEEGDIRPYLPPHPPEIHRFVHACSPAEVEALTRQPDFLRVLAAGSDLPVEDVMAAAVFQAAAARGSGPLADAFVVESGKAIAALFRREPDRFQSVMRRLQAARRSHAAPWERPMDLV